MLLKAAVDRPRHRPATNGPRALMRTTTDLLLATLVTRTMLLKGSVLWAAVSAVGANVSPFAVVCGLPYDASQEPVEITDALPSWFEPAVLAVPAACVVGSLSGVVRLPL